MDLRPLAVELRLSHVAGIAEAAWVTEGRTDHRRNEHRGDFSVPGHLWRLGFTPAPTIGDAERNALLTFLQREEDEEVPEWLLWRVGDLNSLILGFPSFQRK